MTRTYTCDHCNNPMAEPTIVVDYMVCGVDDDGDDTYDDVEVHLCSFACLSGWSVAQEMADIQTTETRED